MWNLRTIFDSYIGDKLEGDPRQFFPEYRIKEIYKYGESEYFEALKKVKKTAVKNTFIFYKDSVLFVVRLNPIKKLKDRR